MADFPTRDDVLRARETIGGRLPRTPLLSNRTMGARLKCELFQRTGSFKVRGALNKISSLSDDERARGVIAISAGNHAQAVAYGAAAEGLDALVVMWEGASAQKIAATRGYGAAVDLEANGPGDAFARLDVLIEETGRTLVHPFDDPLVLAGQGTVGLEIEEDAPDVDVVIVPVGGGGLIGGIQAAIGDGRFWGLAIQYSFDGPELLGTGGAVKRALALLGDDFFVVHGDSYGMCPFYDIESAYRAAEQPALMTVLRNDNRWDKSNVLFRHGRLIEYHKQSDRSDMAHIDFGVSVLSREAFEPYLGSEVLDLADLYRNLSLSGRLAAFEVSNRFYEIGSLSGIRDTEEFLKGRSSPS